MNALGSMVIGVTAFITSQTIVVFFGNCIKVKSIKKLVRFMTIDGPLRPIIILFFLEAYLDLLIGGLINTENNYLIEIP